MNAGRRIVAAAGVLLLLLGAVFGCSLLLRDEAQQTGWHIRLNIAAPAASRAINVSEHEVTALIVRVYDPDDQLLETIDWQPDQGPRSYLVPVSQVGQHRIEVTHIGEDNGTAVQALESALFTIQAMRITVIDIVPGAIGVIQIDGETEQPAKQDGTLTVSVTGVAAPDGTFVPIGVFPAGWDPAVDPDPFGSLLATGGGVVAAGAASDTVRTHVPEGGDDVWIGQGGSFYDVYVWVDMNGNFEETMFLEPGVDLVATVFPTTVEIDGNTVLYFTGGDFELAPDPFAGP